MAGSTATCAGSFDCEIIGGYLGVYPGTSQTGNFAGDFVGDIASTADSAGCAADGLAAWKNGTALTSEDTKLAEMGGVTFTPGVYIHESSVNHALGVVSGNPQVDLDAEGNEYDVFILSKPQVYLDVQGNKDAVFIFNVVTTLTTLCREIVLLVPLSF